APVVAPGDAQHYQRIAQAIDAVLASNPEFQRAHVGVSVTRLFDGVMVYAHDDQQLFVPASNTKLLTTTTGFALLGPDWKTRTTVESAATIDRAGALKGDLILVGRGDPNLSGRVLPYDVKSKPTTPPLQSLQLLANQLAAAGLKRVSGSIIGDDTWFAYERWGDSWGQDDLMWEYGAPVSALTVNDNQMFFTITPAPRAGRRAIVKADPFVDQYTIIDKIVTGAAKSEKRIAIDRQPGSFVINLWGTIPVRAPAEEVGLAMEDPAAFAAAAFRNMLIARGIKVAGTSRARHTDNSTLPITPPENAQPDAPIVVTPLQPLPTPSHQPRVVLAQLESHPLGEDIKIINKVSQNLHVEILMRQLGRERSLLAGSAAGGSVWGGTSVVRQYMTANAGIPADEFQYNDGSGMTPHNLVTPAMLTSLLRFARTQPWADRFLDTLPLAATDGTLEHRFLNTPSAGRIRAKTGSLTEVSALSGYATTLDREELVFSILVNAEKFGGVNRQLVDPIARAIVETR
ncbi:MAG: D-alanyl-D-alanine carboxypeptidase/D-alanyl-D-alanine-endopeptidase, partial [Acidobacteriaceae bacterium]